MCATPPYERTKQARIEGSGHNSDDDDLFRERVWEPLPATISDLPALSWEEVPGPSTLWPWGPWTFRYGDLVIKNPYKLINVIFAMVICTNHPQAVGVRLNMVFSRLTDKIFNLLEEIWGPKAAETSPIRSPWSELLEKVAICRKLYMDEATLPITRTKVMIQAILFQTGYLDADWDQRAQLGIVLTNPRLCCSDASCVGIDTALYRKARMLTKDLRDNLKVMDGEFRDHGVIRTRFEGYSYAWQYGVLTGPDALRWTMEFEMVRVEGW